MSYASAAGSGAAGNGAEQLKDRYYNDNMVVCFANGIQYDQLTEELDKKGYWQYVTGFQRVDYNRRFALAFNRREPRDYLVQHGLDIKGKHVQFGCHKRRIPPKIRVLVAELPIGITDLEICGVFRNCRKIFSVTKVEKFIRNRKIDTGKRIITFTSIAVNIPSYVHVCGWKAFVKYRSQEQTCRRCSQTGHMAKDCPLNRRNDNSTQAENSQDQPGSSQERAKPNTSEMPQNRKENPKAKDPKQLVNTQKDKKSEKVCDDKAHELVRSKRLLKKILVQYLLFET